MKKLYQNQAVRYIFFGGCTTMVNLVIYFALTRFLHTDIMTASLISIPCAILFAYVVNKLFVFEHRTGSMGELLREMGSFIGMRLSTMLVEILGTLLLSCIWGMHDLIAKCVIQIVVLLLNYLISRFFVFREEDEVRDEEALRRKKISRRYFFAGFFLSALVAGIGFIAHGVWPFGDKTLLIVDSLHQYLPFYTDLHRKLVNSESLLYSFAGGLGYNFWSTFAYYLASPINLLMVLIPMEHVCDFMDLVIWLRIGLCGGFFSWYLHQRDPERRYLPAVFGVMYALSNYVLGYYFNLMWLDSIAVLPLIMYGVERIVDGKSGKMFCLSLFYGLWCNYYIGFMLCIFSCLYFLVRWISARRITLRRVLYSGLTFSWYALLAGGLAALVLVPAFLGLSSSESMQGNNFPTTIRFYTNFMEMMLNHFVFLEPINIANTQVGLNAYCGVATVLLAVLYLFDSKIRLRERLAHYALTGLLLLSFAMNILNYIWHGFHIQNGLPNRFAFIYIALLLVMAYDALGHIRSYHFLKLLVSFALPTAFVGYVLVTGYGEVQDALCYITLGILILWFGLLLLGRYALAAKPAVCCALLSAAALVEVSANGIHGILANGGVTRSMYVADQISWKALMNRQQDNTFFRSEVDRQRMRNVTMFVGGNALVMFNSTMQESVIDFCDALGIEARTNKNGYLGVTKLMNDVFGIKYVASPSKQADTMYQFAKIGEDGELALYKNSNALSLGFMVKDSIRQWDIEESEPLQIQNNFVTLATGLDPIFVLDRYITMEDGENYGILIPENKQVYLCIDTRVSDISLRTPEYSKDYSTYTDHLYVINRSATDDMADFTVTLNENQSPVEAEVYTCANDAYQQVVSRLSESQLENLSVKGNKVKGEINVQEAGTLLLTIPYDTGWDILVDGKSTEYVSIGKALTGLSLGTGQHTVEMKYTPPGLWMGSFLSLVCIALYLITGNLERKSAERYGKVWEDPRAESEMNEDGQEAGEGESYGYERRLEDEASEDAWKDTGLYGEIPRTDYENPAADTTDSEAERGVLPSDAGGETEAPISSEETNEVQGTEEPSEEMKVLVSSREADEEQEIGGSAEEPKAPVSSGETDE